MKRISEKILSQETEEKADRQLKAERLKKPAKQGLILLLALIFLGLEIYGFRHGYLRYAAIAGVVFVFVVGLESFTHSYNSLVAGGDPMVKPRLKFAAEKAAATGVVSLTLGVALGIYSLDATNPEANFEKFVGVVRQMDNEAKVLGCQGFRSDPKDCLELQDTVNKLWEAVSASDVKGMSAGVDDVRMRWNILSVRLPREKRPGFLLAAHGLDKLKYWSESTKREIALLLALMMLPFSVGATSRKLAVAAFEARFSEGTVTWRMVSVRATRSVFRTLLRR